MDKANHLVTHLLTPAPHHLHGLRTFRLTRRSRSDGERLGKDITKMQKTMENHRKTMKTMEKTIDKMKNRLKHMEKWHEL